MNSAKASALALIALCQLVGFSYSQSLPNLASFGDFMEFFVGINTACANVTGGQNATKGIIDMFSECTFTLSSQPPKDEFENMAIICQNRQKYLGCWEQLKTDIKRTCGSNTQPMLPVVYAATVSSLCGNDNGAKRIAELKEALADIKEGDQDKCSEETGIHWLESCKTFLTLMNSPDACFRQSAVDRCLSKITCDNIKLARLMRKIYTDGGKELKCKLSSY